MRKKILVGTFLSLFFSFCFGQEVQTPTKDNDARVLIIKTDDNAFKVFKRSRPANPNGGEVGLYTFKMTNNKFIFQPFGFIKPIMGWDIGNSLNDISFIPSRIPVPAKKGNKAAYFANPLHSAIGMHLVGLPNTEHEIVGFVKVMFNGKDGGTQVHNLYISYRGFLLGRDNTLFEDGDAIPETIDPQGPNGAVSTHAYMVSYQKTFKSGLGIGISLELPTFDKYAGRYSGSDHPDLDGMQYYGDASQPVPDIPAYIQYQGKGKNRVRLSGIMRNFFYRDIVNDVTRSVIGWGAQLSGNLQPAKPLVIYYQGTYGRGIANYIQDLNGLTLSYIPENSKPGKMESTPMMGWLAGATYEFENKLTLGGVYSQARVWGSGNYEPYKLGQYVAATLFYPIKDFLTFGVEYLWGSNLEYTHESASLNRIQTSLKLNF